MQAADKQASRQTCLTRAETGEVVKGKLLRGIINDDDEDLIKRYDSMGGA